MGAIVGASGSTASMGVVFAKSEGVGSSTDSIEEIVGLEIFL